MICAAVFGANGAIGSAIVSQLENSGKYDRIVRLSRSKTAEIHIDIESEDSVAEAISELGKMSGELRLCVAATGLLHSSEQSPEKALKQLDPDWMLQNYRVNAVGPALIAKHILPLMPRREEFRFAAISARVGSISDNRLGGWHSYRASKAALNMLLRNLAIEWARRNDQSIVVGLHPGTVDSALSQPFQANVPGGKLFTADYSAAKMMEVLHGLQPADSGEIFAWDGTKIDP